MHAYRQNSSNYLRLRTTIRDVQAQSEYVLAKLLRSMVR